jgi:hypothetical protein
MLKTSSSIFIAFFNVYEKNKEGILSSMDKEKEKLEGK